MEDTVYKVVAARWVDDEVRLFSALMELAGDHMVEYRVGVPVRPALDSFLYAFTDRKAAIEYADSGKGILTNYGALQVWTASAHIVGTEPLQGVDLDPFWAEGQHGLDIPCKNVWPCPPHSVWCEWVQLDGLIYGSSPRKPAKPTQKGKK